MKIGNIYAGKGEIVLLVETHQAKNLQTLLLPRVHLKQLQIWCINK